MHFYIKKKPAVKNVSNWFSPSKIDNIVHMYFYVFISTFDHLVSTTNLSSPFDIVSNVPMYRDDGVDHNSHFVEGKAVESITNW